MFLIGVFSTRGLGKALAREFLLSGDRVIVTSRRFTKLNIWNYGLVFIKKWSLMLCFVWFCFCESSSESVDMTVKELEQNLKEIMSNASESARKKLSDAKVVGIACDVCKPEDVEKLSNFAVKELGSINIWVKTCFIVTFSSFSYFSSYVYSLLTVFIQLDR